MADSKFQVVIIGAGSGGVSIAARLKKRLGSGKVAILDPAKFHYYQPMWTLAGAGVVQKQVTERPMESLIPDGVSFIQEAAESIQPEKNQIALKTGRVVAYEYLVVAPGLRLAWEKNPGAKESLGKNGVCSIYEYDQVDKTSEMLQSFKGGTAIFVMPPVPIKCAGAPQKIMYLADEVFRRNGVREKSKIYFATAGKAMFGIPTFSKALEKVVQRKHIEPLYQHKLLSIDGSKKIALFSVADSDGKTKEVSLPYDLIHVVPPMAAPTLISEGPLAVKEGDQKGWLSVDKNTLQHTQFPNVFGVGDVTGVPNSKTGAAIRKQAPVVVENLMSVIRGEKPTALYDGYSSCPLVTGFGKVMLAEFGYDGKLMPTFPVDPTKERHSMWILKRHLLPILYWYGMLKGRA